MGSRYERKRAGEFSTDDMDTGWLGLFIRPKTLFRQSRWMLRYVMKYAMMIVGKKRYDFWQSN